MKIKTQKVLRMGLVSMLAISVTVLPSTAAKAKAPTVLKVARLGNISQAFGPTRQGTGSDAFINAMVYSNLVKVAPDEKTILPDLATTWSTSTDAKTVTFHLRDNVKWKNGKTFSADDVIFTINMACRFGPTAFQGYQPVMWRLVRGCNDVANTTKNVSGAIKVDARNVKLLLSSPNSQFVRLLTDAVYSIVPKNLNDGLTLAQYAVSDPVVSAPVGTGPYLMTKFVRNQYIEFTANMNYFGRKPKIHTIYWYVNLKPTDVLPLLQKGQLDLAIDVAVDLAPQIEALSGYKAVWNTSAAGEFFEFRADQGMAANKKVRQAVMYAVDRRSMLKNLFGGHGDVNWVLGGFDKTNPNLDTYPYDPEKAKKLLKESGVDLSQTFEIMYSPTTDPAWPKMVPVIQQQLEAVGLKVKLNPVDQAAWVALYSTNKGITYDLTLNSGGALGLGAARSSNYFNCKNPQDSWYANCALDALYLKALGIANKDKQKAVYDQIAEIINDQVPFVTLWQKQTLNAVSNKLGGKFALFSNDRDTSFNVMDWTLATK